jgi:hypothetical protein
VNVDAKLIERAMFHNWPVPRDTRRKAIDRMARIIESSDARPRDYAAAARVLLSASRVSLDSVKTVIAAQDHSDLCKRVAKITKNDELAEERRAKARQSSR